MALDTENFLPMTHERLLWAATKAFGLAMFLRTTRRAEAELRLRSLNQLVSGWTRETSRCHSTDKHYQLGKQA
jgi:hypothetical protein